MKFKQIYPIVDKKTKKTKRTKENKFPISVPYEENFKYFKAMVCIVKTEWDLGLNGTLFNENHIGIYIDKENAIEAVKNAYYNLISDNENDYIEALEKGQIIYKNLELN